MNKPACNLTYCPDYDTKKISACLQRHFDLLGPAIKSIKPSDTVLLKPNFISPRPPEVATQTHPAVIIETAKLIKDLGAKPFVGDSPAWGNIKSCAQKLNLIEPLKKLNVPLVHLNKPKRCKIGSHRTAIGISSIALDADVIINLSKFKSHQQLVATFAVKNMFGTVTGKRKALWHFKKGKSPQTFCTLLIEIYQFLSPLITIIDAVYAMDGPGPINGRTRPFGWLISGTDPIALEFTCCKLINLDPNLVPIITTAQKIGFGCPDPDKIQFLGDDFSGRICTDFLLPELIPIRFSLPRVCKSIAKQTLILLKSACNRKKGSS